MLYLSEVLQGVADQIEKLLPTPRKNSKPRYAMVTVNLVDHIMAYSKTAMLFARYLDPEKYDCYLYFAEETWGEKPQDFAIEFSFLSSYKTAPEFMQELKQLPVTVKTCSPVNAIDSAKWLAEAMQKDQIDGVIFQAGVNASVKWVASAICDVPVRVSLCLGLNMYQAGQEQPFI
ncbi:MAG: hypothetical protein MK132_06375 [Lentisphaerales bacterium]|nr:hypothetical protein [Lentisphaerales bacterium]